MEYDFYEPFQIYFCDFYESIQLVNGQSFAVASRIRFTIPQSPIAR